MPHADTRLMKVAAAPARGGVSLRVARAVGGVVGYGCLAAFLCVIGVQVYLWLRDGEWTHFGINEGLRVGLTRCCVHDGDVGHLASLMHWLDAPADWLGLHKVLEIVPASLALFAVSIFGNSLFIYCRDRLEDRR